MLDSDSLVEVPGRHVSRDDALADRFHPRPRFLIGDERHGRHRADAMTLFAFGLENGSDILGEGDGSVTGVRSGECGLENHDNTERSNVPLQHGLCHEAFSSYDLKSSLFACVGYVNAEVGRGCSVEERMCEKSGNDRSRWSRLQRAVGAVSESLSTWMCRRTMALPAVTGSDP